MQKEVVKAHISQCNTK